MKLADSIKKKHPFIVLLYRSILTLYKEFLFILDYLDYKKKDSRKRFMQNWRDRYLCLDDKTKNSNFDRHYIYHTAWAARVLSRLQPKEHVDISSFLYFSTIVSAFIPTTFYDYRPASVELDGLKVGQADLTKLPFKNNSIASLSCMHVLEHIGLGRYGDTIFPEGDLLAIEELIRVLAFGGHLLIVVPVGKPKIMFNAHRIYSYEQILNYFIKLKLEEFFFISENQNTGGLISNPPQEWVESEEYGCGCFLFKKLDC